MPIPFRRALRRAARAPLRRRALLPFLSGLCSFHKWTLSLRSGRCCTSSSRQSGCTGPSTTTNVRGIHEMNIRYLDCFLSYLSLFDTFLCYFITILVSFVPYSVHICIESLSTCSSSPSCIPSCISYPLHSPSLSISSPTALPQYCY